MLSNNTKFKVDFFHPRYWMTWFWLGLWRLVTLLPYPALLILGKLLGLILLQLPTDRKHIAFTNIQRCFPALSLIEQKKLLKANFLSMGISLMEVGMAWWWSKQRLDSLVTVEGVENLDRSSNQGIILLGLHFTTLEIGAAALTGAMEIDGMYRPHANSVYDFVQLKGRISHNVQGCNLFSRNDVRGTMKSLKNGRVLWYLPDQDYGIKRGVFAPFFDIQAATIYGTARLAEKTGASVVPVIFTRLPEAKGYKVTIKSALEKFPTGDDLIDATRINNLAEELIRLQPEQYLWAHRRFKTRPSGESDLYTK
ncbi:MAG: LpxL/LpxP family Kdo(2)-lipid IV(A) lauroyl/palmitoleoyl acyltransferase [Porticoccaceae bacterium]|nr:LpxL/LpxP family Kdo(2)-lipid IV(A) lauroyl/palmitoleoyl acyltransferase [Porticoccaceae bacterium]